jgi:hypothetical protein
MQEPSPLPGPSTWTIANTIVTTAATVAVAWFAWVELRRQKRESETRQAGIDARASAEAFLLRRELLRILGREGTRNLTEGGKVWTTHELDENTGADGVEMRLREISGAGHPKGALEPTLDRVRNLLALAANASPTVGRNIRDASVHLLEGARRLEEYLTTVQPDGAEFMDWIQLRTDGIQDLRAGTAILEAGVIEAELLNAEMISRQTRAEQNPWHRMANAVGRVARERIADEPRREDGPHSPDKGA